MPKKNLSTLILRWVLATLFCLPIVERVSAASSVTHYGITWTFSADRTTGTFVNGEPWVVGPVTITAINPNPSQSVQGVQHGSMVNPIPGKNFGFDDHPSVTRDIVYEAAKNAALNLPLTLNPGDVIVSAKSQLEYPTWLKTVCALTVLNSPPPAGSFRPGIFGSTRSVKWNVSQVNWNVLKNYAAVPATPSKAEILSYLPPLPWFEWAGIWSGNSLQPRDNTADGGKEYGREIAAKFGHIGLWLNTNQPLADKQEVAIRLIQNGIDIYSLVKQGVGFYPDGGHKCGRKLPVVMTAMLLNDPDIKAVAGTGSNGTFQEDGQVWFVTQSDVGRVVNMNYPGYVCSTYLQEDVGMAEWGIRHCFVPFEDNRTWNTGYRMVVGPGMMGPWMAAYLMGAQTVWNHPAAFAYMQRYKSIQGTGGVTTSQVSFNQQMWTAYIGSGTTVTPPNATAANPVISPSSGYFETSQSVSITCSTASSTIRYTLDGSTPTSSSTAYTGPFQVGSTTTIKAIAYASGMDPSGVSTAQLSFAASPPAFSPAPGGFSSAQNVTLSTTTSGAVIRYTTDGSDPTASSPVFGSAIPVSTSTTIKAAAFKSGLEASPVVTGVYAIGQIVGAPDWVSVAINPARTEAFMYSFDVTPSATNIDAVVGLSGVNPITAYTDLACIVRFNTSGKLDVRSGSTYSASVDYPYAAGTTYKIRMLVYPGSKTYDVKVSSNGGSSFVDLAKGASFRSEQSSLASFKCMGVAAASGTHSVSNFGVTSDRPGQVQSTNATRNP